MADPTNYDAKFIEQRAKKLRLQLHRMEPGKLEPTNKLCLHYVLGICRSDYAIEAGSIYEAMRYADKIFGGLDEDTFITLHGFFKIRPMPQQLSFQF